MRPNVESGVGKGLSEKMTCQEKSRSAKEKTVPAGRNNVKAVEQVGTVHVKKGETSSAART